MDTIHVDADRPKMYDVHLKLYAVHHLAGVANMVAKTVVVTGVSTELDVASSKP